MTLVSSKDVRAIAVKKANIQDMKQVQTQLTKILNFNPDSNEIEKVQLIEDLMVSSENLTNELLVHGFNELSKQNKDLSFQLSTQQKQLSSEFSQQKNILEEQLGTKMNQLNQQLNEI